MKQALVLLGIFCLTVLTGFAQQADQVLGQWLSEGKDGKIEIYKTGDKYFGKLVWLQKLYEADGKTLRKDSKNPEVSLRSRSLINLVLLTNFIFDDGAWVDGKIYDPQTGKTYSCKMTLKGNLLNIRGYIGAPMFGRTTVWSRSN